MTRPSKRYGFSLMEVILATAILLGSVVVLVELAGIGRHHAQSAQQRAIGQLLCQNKMNEMLAGVAPLESVQAEPLEMAVSDGAAAFTEEVTTGPSWWYSVELTSTSMPALSAVRIVVWQAVDADDEPRNVFSLVRWVRSSSEGQGEDLMGPAFGLPGS